MKRLLLVLFTLVSRAFGHDVWLEVSPASPAPEEAIGVSLKQGDRFEGAIEIPRSETHLEQFRVWYADGSSEDVVGMQNETPVGVTNFPQPGNYVLAYLSKPQLVKLDGLTFEKHLLHEGYEELIRERHRKGESSAAIEESYIRCVKSGVRVGEGGAPAVKAVGLPLEIVVDEMNSSEVKVQLLYEGKPAAGLLLFAKRRGAETEKAIRTDSAGQAAFSIAEPGFWILRSVMIQPPTVPGEAWRSYWASYSFFK